MIPFVPSHNERPFFATTRRVAGAAMVALVLLAAGCHTANRQAEWTFDDYYQAGLEAYRARDDKKAEEYFQAALQKNPLHASTHYYLAVVYAARGQEDMAIAGFQRAIQLEPNFPEAYYNLGTLQLNRGEAVVSAQLFERAISLRPDFSPAYVNLGKAYYLSNLPEMAGAAFEEALSKDPGNRVALQNLVVLAHAAGDREAEEGYRRRLDSLTP